MFSLLKKLFSSKKKTANEQPVWNPQWSAYLEKTVAFYRGLSEEDKKLFEQRILLFWQTTPIEGGVEVEVSDKDRLLVAASAIIPVWGFKGWHYFNLAKVFLLPGTFNKDFQCGEPDSLISGMVGVGPMTGKMALSKPDLHYGFQNTMDKNNVGIHEFAHLLDMQDGQLDGFLSSVKNYPMAAHWYDLVAHKINQIEHNKSNIREYGMTNNAEFFAVASEYFFERPDLLARKHPDLFEALEKIYQQDVKEIRDDIHSRRKAPCLCGSGEDYENCCMPRE